MSQGKSLNIIYLLVGENILIVLHRRLLRMCRGIQLEKIRANDCLALKCP